jgi:hypothetical protein
MPPKLKPAGVSSTTTIVASNDVNHDDEQVDSRPQTPMDAMNFSNYEFSGIFVEEMGQHDTLDNERKSEVFTAIGYTCTGLKVVIQAWAPYDKDVHNFMK